MTQQDSCINWTKWAKDMAQGQDLVRKRACEWGAWLKLLQGMVSLSLCLQGANSSMARESSQQLQCRGYVCGLVTRVFVPLDSGFERDREKCRRSGGHRGGSPGRKATAPAP